MDISITQTIKLDPIKVDEFLKEINRDFAIRYLEHICLKPELGSKQRDIHNRIVYAYCDRMKQLANELRLMLKEKQNDTQQYQQSLYQGISFCYLTLR